MNLQELWEHSKEVGEKDARSLTDEQLARNMTLVLETMLESKKYAEMRDLESFLLGVQHSLLNEYTRRWKEGQ